MATWTNIPDSVLEPGKPARSVDAIALRDNPIAIAEGASGAPRVHNEALMRATAGSTFTLFSAFQGVSVTAPKLTSFPNAADSVFASGSNIPISIMCSGVIRVSFRHRGSGISSAQHSARVVLNGNVIQTWTTPNNTVWQNRTIDVSVSIGDRLALQGRVTDVSAADAYWGNFLIQSGTRCLGVA